MQKNLEELALWIELNRQPLWEAAWLILKQLKGCKQRVENCYYKDFLRDASFVEWAMQRTRLQRLVKQRKIHNFREDLEYSLKASDDLMFEFYYKQRFNAVSVKNITDLDKQKAGIDKEIYLPNGKILLVDEKKRREVYFDILLEEYSNMKYKVPGWIEKNQSDYIVYAFMPSRVIYLLPVLLLQLAWNRNRSSWKIRYKYVTAFNEGYVTGSIAVPVPVLFDAIEREIYDNVDFYIADGVHVYQEPTGQFAFNWAIKI